MLFNHFPADFVTRRNENRAGPSQTRGNGFCILSSDRPWNGVLVIGIRNVEGRDLIGRIDSLVDLNLGVDEGSFLERSAVGIVELLPLRGTAQNPPKIDGHLALVPVILIPGRGKPENIAVVRPAPPGPGAFLVNSDKLSDFTVDVAPFGSELVPGTISTVHGGSGGGGATMPSTAYYLFLLPVLFFSASVVSSHNRRILHQPFVPIDSLPPSLPSPSPLPPPPAADGAPDYPFSPSTHNTTPFFPETLSPPPPPALFSSIPANISSFNVTQASKPKTTSKLVASAVACVVAAVILVSVAVTLHLRKIRKRSSSESKPERSVTSTPFDYGNNDGGDPVIPKLGRPSKPSSEYLYLGTMVNSRGAIESHSQQYSRSSTNTSAASSRKIDSPELQPLPPFVLGRNFRQNTDAESFRDGEDEEFYSPRGSLGGRESSIGTGSASRRAFAAIEVQNFGGAHYSSSSSSSSGSCSPQRSVSLSISPPASSSPKSSNSNLPELVSGQTALPPPPQHPPPRPPISVPRPVIERESQSTSPAGSSSPEGDSRSSCSSSPRVSHIWDQFIDSPILNSPVRISSPLVESPIRIRSPVAIGSPAKGSSLELESLPRNDHVNQSPARNNRPGRESPVRTSSPVMESPGRTSSPVMESQARSSGHIFGSLPRINNPLVDSPSPQRISSTDMESPSRTCIPHNMEFPMRNSSSSLDPPMTTAEAGMESPARISSNILDSHPRINIPVPAKESSLCMNSHDRSDMESSKIISCPVNQNVPKLAPPRPPPAPPISIPSQPPTPPPPPPSKHWESPTTPNPKPKIIVSEPPDLVNLVRPISIDSPTLISPIQFPSHSEEPVNRNSDIHENGSPVENGEAPKPKLKPLHWDKVRASSDREMVWDQIKSSSFKLNEERIETLFVVNTPNSIKKEIVRHSTLPSQSQENRVLDPKKSQNIAILLRALNVTTEEVCDALLEGNADSLGTELLESLMKMAPSKEEERKLKAYKDDSPFKLGPAEKFLKTVLDIPFAFKRVDAMLYVSNFESEIEYLQTSFQTLEAACEELRSSRMFLKLLEAVLKTGNRMNVGTNRGDARAFKLDTLLKLVDVKGADGKTTLLHFVVQEIIRSEGTRLSTTNQSSIGSDDDAKCRKIGLQVVSSLCSSELTNVKNAAAMDAEVLHSEVFKLSQGIANIKEFVRLNESNSQKFSQSMKRFTEMAEGEILKLQALESVAMSLVKEITEYFHGNSAKEEAHPLRIFMVVRDFLVVLERVCKEVGTINEQTIVSSAHKFPVPVNPMQFPVPVNPMLQRP
ncbi:unnamed protein product [Cuscuta campestris]|uniref:Formin-like protein n=1 Tax=Cuscuta campestris TaxID=132261 RepID=A0A484L0U9_9ASTE|nr:unnamed protein product [Cuscuta campestris]